MVDSDFFIYPERIRRTLFRVAVQKIQEGVIEPTWIINEKQTSLLNNCHHVSVSMFALALPLRRHDRIGVAGRTPNAVAAVAGADAQELEFRRGL